MFFRFLKKIFHLHLQAVYISYFSQKRKCKITFDQPKRLTRKSFFDIVKKRSLKKGKTMTIEKERTLLSTLTRISDSVEIRNYERSFLHQYAKIMNNRYNFILNRQKAEQQKLPDDLFSLLNNKEN